jgi:23S rRNA pseudouridine2605 synthase
MSKNQQFQKFITYKSNAAKKEEFKREKKAFKKERAAAIEKRFEEKRKMKQQLKTPKPATEDQKPKFKTQESKAGAQPAGISPQAADRMPLNKYVAHSGVCSRRDAAELIKKGEVKVNDVIIKEPGTKVSSGDTITIKGKMLSPSRNRVYILLNKPKDYITTLDDPEGRKTVLDLIKRATDERVYPVGRLDRNTSGVLLITNDGDLAQTLSHPKNLIKKIYEVRLDKPVTKADFEKIIQGVTLEDGFIAPDSLGYADPKDKSIIGIEIHSGRNRIVRRIFEHLGYDVRQLDRVMYAGLTKKNVQRGKWRFLTEKEVRILRHFNPQTKKDREKPVKSLPKQRIDKKQ